MVTEKALVIPKTGEVIKAGEFSLALRDTIELGQLLAESGMFPDCKNKAQAVAKILLGRELGLSPVYSLQKIYVVQGRLQIGYELVAALINRSEHYRYIVDSCDDASCHLTFLRDGQILGKMVWTIQDAQKAGLNKPDSNWAKYPDVMLFARAITQGARRYCPELLAGTEILDEAGREVSPNGELTKAGEPPPSAWMRFWGEARKKGYNDDDSVHKVLGVESVKAWLDQGKSLDDALKALPNLQAEKDAEELFGTGVKSATEPVKIIIARPAPTATEPPNPSPMMGEGNNSRAQGPGGKTPNTVAKDEGYPPVQNWGEMAAKINNLGVTSTSVISRAGYKRWQDFTDNCGGVEGGFRKAWEIAQAIKAGK